MSDSPFPFPDTPRAGSGAPDAPIIPECRPPAKAAECTNLQPQMPGRTRNSDKCSSAKDKNKDKHKNMTKNGWHKALSADGACRNRGKGAIIKTNVK
jgi:hypothetical protein